MGPLSRLVGQRVYLDANVFIYAVEGFRPAEEIVTAIFAGIDAGLIDAMTSELTLAEVLVKPIRTGATEVVEVYRDLIRSSGSLHVVPITRDVLEDAASLRATTGMKMPDAIHVATARRQGCERFVSNDATIQVPPPIELVRPL